MLRILLVDDDEAFADALQIVLRQEGCQIIRAQDGKEALRRYDSKVIDLVLTDLVMPGMEGIEFITKLREMHQDVKSSPCPGGDKFS